MNTAVRLAILGVVFLSTSVLAHRAMRPEAVPARETLANLPWALGDWRGVPATPFENRIVEVLGVDDYINRYYVNREQIHVGLYIGYYESQRQGDSIHSPLNCLPGSGWEPVEKARVSIDIPGRGAVEVNRFVIQKGLDRQVVLYWYQSQGRIVASEYASKAYLIYDSMRHNRSEAAMVRIISPILPGEVDDGPAGDRVVAFTQELLPRLSTFLPS
jgi:EpsI family protein